MKRIFAFLAPAPAAAPAASGADVHRRAFLAALLGGVVVTAQANASSAGALLPAPPTPAELDEVATDYALRVRIRWRRRRGYRRRSRGYSRRSRRRRGSDRFRERAEPMESPPAAPSSAQPQFPAVPAPAGRPRIRFD